MSEQGIVIQCKSCQRRVVFCTRCWRGQKYCSLECRKQSRAQQLKKANKLYAATAQGQKNNRARQNKFRQKNENTKKNITDHTSKVLIKVLYDLSPIDPRECIRCGLKLSYFFYFKRDRRFDL